MWLPKAQIDKLTTDPSDLGPTKKGPTMNIETFLSESLKQIIQGVQNAQDFVEREGRGAKVNPRGITALEKDSNRQKQAHDIETKLPVENVQFDIAVTALESSEKSGAGGLQVAVLRIGGGVEQSAENATVSRITFTVPIVLPDPYTAKKTAD